MAARDPPWLGQYLGQDELAAGRGRVDAQFEAGTELGRVTHKPSAGQLLVDQKGRLQLDASARRAAATQLSPLSVHMRGLTFTLTGPFGPVNCHWSPIAMRL